MMALIKRKEELMNLVNCYKVADNQDIIAILKNDLNDLVLLDNSKMLGRDFSLAKSSNPLDPSSLSLNTLQT
jgi:hypothetical protein